jgi:ABC-type sugar transport system ATPase subunit
MSSEIVLEMKNICKSFPGVRALNEINFTLKKGCVHALLGENGAGKSTLMKILSGIYIPDEGEIFINGEKKFFHNTKDAQNEGISIIHQELNLCWNLSVAANIFVGREDCGKLGFLKEEETRRRAKEVLRQLEVDYIDVQEIVQNLSVAQQQMVEIAKAISMDAKILIMDEPTSALTDKETKILFKTIKNLKEKGVSIVYISHRLEEIFQICDEITVIRDGTYIGSMEVKNASTDKLISMMVGRELTSMYPAKKHENVEKEYNDTVLEVKNLTKCGMIQDINFSLKKGEILGISGLVGAGRTELAKVLFGRFSKDSGTIIINGKAASINSPRDAIQHGIGLVTEDRKAEGLVLMLSIMHNISSSNMERVCNSLGLVSSKKEVDLALDGIEKLRIKTPSEHQMVKNLSGGNQQKVILAKWLATNPIVLILDEPTRGIDIGAKAEIYTIMRELAQQGVGIIMISSELPEVLGMSDRILIMRNGRIAGELSKEEATQEKIMYYATGGYEVGHRNSNIQ